MGNGLLQSIADNVIFVLVCVGVAAALFLIAYGTEKTVQKKNGVTERILTTRKITMIGLFSALSVILHMMDFPVPFLAPGFYQLDFSEIPALVGAFAFGPVVGVLIEQDPLKAGNQGNEHSLCGRPCQFCDRLQPCSARVDPVHV